jgi:hypothetical protein
MSEYQAILIRLSGKVLEDEETVTDELNDRRRGGWALFQLVPLSPRRVLAVFQREG